MLTLKLIGADSCEQMAINRKVGKLGEEFAKDHYRRNGFYTLDTQAGMFFDFMAIKLDLKNWKLRFVFVEVKVGDAQLSRRQRWFKSWCKRAKQEFDEHRIPRIHLEYLMENRITGGDLD